MPLLTTEQVNICTDFVVRAGLAGDTLSRQALLVRIGEELANHQSDGVTAVVFSTLLVNELSQREDRETIARLLDVLSEVLPREEGIRSLQRSVGVIRGLLALGELLSNPRVRDAAGEFRAIFAATRARIGPVVTYKLVHDQLHDLEFNCHDRARNNLERFRDPGRSSLGRCYWLGSAANTPGRVADCIGFGASGRNCRRNHRGKRGPLQRNRQASAQPEDSTGIHQQCRTQS